MFLPDIFRLSLTKRSNRSYFSSFIYWITYLACAHSQH